MNPLLKDVEFVPFNEIGDKDYLPALKEAIEIAKKEISKIKSASSSFDATIVSLESSGRGIERISEIFTNMLSAETNETLQDIAKEFMPLLTNYSNDILLDKDLYNKVEEVKESSKGLDDEEQMLLNKTYRAFVRGGANLDEVQKEQLRAIDEELSKLSLEYGDNVLKVTNEYYMLVENEKQLTGLPERSIVAAKNKAKEKEHENGWAFTLDIPSVMPFLTYCDDRNLRSELYMALTSRCVEGESSNCGKIKKILELRSQRAKLLGYETHSHYILSERMAKNPETVINFLEELKEKSLPKANKDMEELKNYAKDLDGISNFSSWDHYYYLEKLKMERFSIDDEVLRPYFALDRVLFGAFNCATKLYGITFKERTDIPTYHQDVSTFEVIDSDGSEIGLLYADFFPREGKRNGAWMTDYRKQYLDDSGKDIRPHISIVCNFTPAAEDAPSLLSFNEASTLFHEFGHALHGLLSRCRFSSLSGTNVYWDFVELPSQIMENWMFEADCLNSFAKHYKTDEAIEVSLIEKIKQSSNFFESVQTLRQLGFGTLDMRWHTTSPQDIDSVIDFEHGVLKNLSLLPLVKGTSMSCSFSHIFSGGYSSGYYSYKWAEVLDADAFELFKEKGIFNRDVGMSFRNNVLSRGGTAHPMDLYKNFRGREPSNDALLRRSGIS